MSAIATHKTIPSTLETTTGTKPLGLFLVLTFALTWGLAGLFFLFPEPFTAIFGEPGLTNPVVILAIYAPGIVGVSLVGWNYGWKGLGSFFKRLSLWRMPLGWWLFLILGIPAVVYTGAALKGTLNDPLPFSAWYEALPALALALVLGPIEEFGWRGLALPRLQRRFSPFWAGLILGCIWALWHVPSFFISGMPQTAWAVGPYFMGIIAISVILTPMFNDSRGSLLVAILYHFQMMNPLFPDAQPWDNLLFVLVAVIVVIVQRRKMFRLDSGVKNVL
jgi:uncharacterized protein